MVALARAVVLLLLMVAAAPAHAHTLSVARVELARAAGSTGAQVEVDLSLRDLALTLPLDANRDEQVTWGELDAVRAPLQRFVVDGLGIASDAGRCTLRPLGLATRRYDDGAYASVRMAVECPSARGWQVDYRLLFDVDPEHRALLTLRDGDDVQVQTRGRDGGPVAFGPAGDGQARRAGTPALLGFLREGVHHILIGYDHLAFLLSLLLPAALRRRDGQWVPATHLREPLLHVLGIVTAFTVAHSVTLSLAALGWVAPASRAVEAAIALSVLLAALNNLRPVVTRRLWLVGLCFGLIHGFGFAGALGELGLPADARLLALVGFNLGVELGQLAVVCVVLPLLFVLRRQRWYARVALPLLSLAICAVAIAWLWQRLG